MRERACLRRVCVLACAAVLVGLGGCGSTNNRPSGLVFPATAASVGVQPGVRGVDALDGAPINPFDPVALNNQAVVEAARGRYQHALSLLQRAVKLAPARADIAANLLSLQRWMAQVEGQAALGMEPQPLQVPLPEADGPDIPPLWAPPPSVASPRPQTGPTVGGRPSDRTPASPSLNTVPPANSGRGASPAR